MKTKFLRTITPKATILASNHPVYSRAKEELLSLLPFTEDMDPLLWSCEPKDCGQIGHDFITEFNFSMPAMEGVMTLAKVLHEWELRASLPNLEFV